MIFYGFWNIFGLYDGLCVIDRIGYDDYSIIIR